MQGCSYVFLEFSCLGKSDGAKEGEAVVPAYGNANRRGQSNGERFRHDQRAPPNSDNIAPDEVWFLHLCRCPIRIRNACNAEALKRLHRRRGSARTGPFAEESQRAERHASARLRVPGPVAEFCFE